MGMVSNKKTAPKGVPATEQYAPIIKKRTENFYVLCPLFRNAILVMSDETRRIASQFVSPL